MSLHGKLDKHDDPDHVDFFGPRPPAGYASLRAAPSQILLPLTVSNKCGQAFRWRGNKVWEPQGPVQSSGSGSVVLDEQVEWSLCLSDRVVLLRQDEHRGFLYHKTLLPSSSSSAKLENDAAIIEETERWLNDYLNLDVPLEALYAEWEAKDAVFARFATRFLGLRMLRQDPWECLCAFVCSSNNNIARIGQMVQNLCTHFSPPLLEHTYPAPPSSLDGADRPDTPSFPASGSQTHEVEQGDVRIAYHPFPPPEALAKPGVEEKLRELGFGYRAKYLAKTAQMLCEQHGKGGVTKADALDAKQGAQHLDESHWLYGIKAEEIVDFKWLPGVSLPATPVSEDGSKDAGHAESTRSSKRARRASTRTSRDSSTSVRAKESQQSSASSASPGALEGDPKKSFESVRSYLQHLRTLSYQEARQELIQFPGVGPKVADCILLMSLDQASSIPVDRHVFQFAEKWYRLRTKRYEEIADYFRELWGEYAGWAHSVLFTADLRSFATYNTAKKEEAEAEATGATFWGKTEAAEETGLPTPPSSRLVKEDPEALLQKVHSPPRIAIPELVPQSLDDGRATLAERIKSRPKRKSRRS